MMAEGRMDGYASRLAWLLLLLLLLLLEECLSCELQAEVRSGSCLQKRNHLMASARSFQNMGIHGRKKAQENR